MKAPILALKNITITMVRPARDLRDLHTMEVRAQREDIDMVVDMAVAMVILSLSTSQKPVVIGSLSLSLYTMSQTTIMSTGNLGREARGRREDMKMAMDITLSPRWSLNWLATLAMVTGDKVLDVFGIRRKY